MLISVFLVPRTGLAHSRTQAGKWRQQLKESIQRVLQRGGCSWLWWPQVVRETYLVWEGDGSRRPVAGATLVERILMSQSIRLLKMLSREMLAAVLGVTHSGEGATYCWRPETAMTAFCLDNCMDAGFKAHS
jgi:hypothetical protein